MILCPLDFTITFTKMSFILTPVIAIRLIKHTERLLEEKEEKLCIKVLQTLKEMMTVDIDYGEKVRVFPFGFSHS